MMDFDVDRTLASREAIVAVVDQQLRDVTGYQDSWYPVTCWRFITVPGTFAKGSCLLNVNCLCR